jgi:hypothetical protein
MLSSGGIQISSGKEYALCDVIDAIKYAFGGSPQIICKKGSVEELRLCFNKDLKVRSPFPLMNIDLQYVIIGANIAKYCSLQWPWHIFKSIPTGLTIYIC